jgi:hypothetical protein
MERRKFVIGLGSLAAGGAAATGTGAFSAAQIDGREADIGISGDTGALIQLIPGNNDEAPDVGSVDPANSTVPDDRVFLESGQLGISFNDDGGGDGVNADSVYQVGAIGNDAADALGDAASALSTATPVYGAGAPGSNSDRTTYDDPAFYLVNETNEDYRVEIRFNPTQSPDDDGVGADEAAAAFVSDLGASGATTSSNNTPDVAFLDITNVNGRVAIDVTSGTAVGFSLITSVEDITAATGGWEGDLQFNVGENDVAGGEDNTP